MTEHRTPRLEDGAPMVLRTVPPERRDLARALLARGAGGSLEGADGQWWEWVDAAAETQSPAAAVALTEALPGGRVVVSALGAASDDGGAGGAGAYDELLQALLATLRSHCVDTVLMRKAEGPLVRALLAAGFTPDPEGDEGYVVAL